MPEDSSIQREIEDPEAGPSSLDASQSEAFEAMTVEESNNTCEGKEMAYDRVSDVVRAGGDVISICSLD